MKKLIATGYLLVLTAITGSALTVEETFVNYADFDPAHKSFMFRGAAGEVIGGEYCFNGVALTREEEGDIHPELTMGQLRDFPAGTDLAIDAKIRLGKKSFSYLTKNDGKKCVGVVMLGRYFSRNRRDALEDIPAVMLLISRNADGKYTMGFSTIGIAAPKNDKTFDAVPDGVYRFKLSLHNNVVTGLISDADDKILFESSWSNPQLGEVLATAHPGIVDQRFEAGLQSFKADNFNSNDRRTALSIPAATDWLLVIGGQEPQAVKLDNGRLDIGKLVKTFQSTDKAVLSGVIEVKRAGIYYASIRGDWFWKLFVNDQIVSDLSKKGNGNQSHILPLPLKEGKNTIRIELAPGNAGWSVQFGPPEREALRNQIAAGHLYGAGVLFWNLDRLIDDINNLKRWGISLPCEKNIMELRRNLPGNLSRYEIPAYNAILDGFYLEVYNAYRVVALEDTIRELEGLSQITGKTVDTERLKEIHKQLFDALQNPEYAGLFESLSAEVQKITDKSFNELGGFREGVSFGRNFGRFGWITGNKISSYASGDGLLANQLLSSGALLRQYVGDGKNPWKVDFHFDGNCDDKAAKRLGSEPTAGNNLDLEFGYDPANFYTGGTPKEVAVKAINWIHKKFAYGNSFTADMSLASPALLLESAYDTLTLSDPAFSPYQYLGYRDADGKIQSQPLADNKIIYDRKIHGKLGRNWVVFWSGQNNDKDLSGHQGSVPLQLIFQRNPESIERRGNQIVVKLGVNGAVWLNTPFGVRIQPTGNWFGNLPPTAVGRCDLHAQMALAYPVGMREYYRLDSDDQRMEIVNKFSYRLFADNDWKLEPLKYAPVPPVLSLMTDREFDGKAAKKLYDLGYPTIYGPLRGAVGDTLRYTLPIPEVPRMEFPQNLEADPKNAEQLVKLSENYMEGARYRQFCENIGRSWHSISYAPDRVMKSWNYLPGDFRDYLCSMSGFLIDFTASYRDYRFWRSLCEPYSGAKYFYSFSISAGGPGDTGVFGDRGYGVANHLLMLDMLSAYSGNYDELAGVWRDPSNFAPRNALRNGRTVTVDKMSGYFKDVHDWAWMEAGSNDCGDNGPVVDCGQAVFGGHAAMYRMAQSIGNDFEKAESAYYLAKSQLSQLGRPVFRDYGRSNGVLGPDNINVGFREFITPDSYANSPMIGKTPRNEYDGSYDSLICYANEDWPEILSLYAKYVWPDLRYYEKERLLYWPNRDYGKSEMMGHLYSRLVFMMLDGLSQEEAMAMLRHWTKDSVFYIKNAAFREVMPLAMTGGSPLTLNEWYPLAAPEFSVRPSEKKAWIKLKNVPSDGYQLKATSVYSPTAVKLDGEPLSESDWTYTPGSYALTITLPPAEECTVEIDYDQWLPGKLMLMKIPDKKPSVAPAPLMEIKKVEFAPGAPVSGSGKP